MDLAWRRMVKDPVRATIYLKSTAIDAGKPGKYLLAQHEFDAKRRRLPEEPSWCDAHVPE